MPIPLVVRIALRLAAATRYAPLHCLHAAAMPIQQHGPTTPVYPRPVAAHQRCVQATRMSGMHDVWSEMSAKKIFLRMNLLICCWLHVPIRPPHRPRCAYIWCHDEEMHERRVVCARVLCLQKDDRWLCHVYSTLTSKGAHTHSHAHKRTHSETPKCSSAVRDQHALRGTTHQ